MTEEAEGRGERSGSPLTFHRVLGEGKRGGGVCEECSRAGDRKKKKSLLTIVFSSGDPQSPGEGEKKEPVATPAGCRKEEEERGKCLLYNYSLLRKEEKSRSAVATAREGEKGGKRGGVPLYFLRGA